MNSPNGSNPLYGNHQQQFAATQLNQPTTSLFMQPFQQSPNNSQQQYEVCQIQPTNLHQTYNTQYPPLNYQQTNLQQMYNSHFPPLPLLHNAKQTIVTTQSESDEDLELEECSDKETQEPVHEWQSVDKTKKRKTELTQKNEDKTKQTYITTSNRFETLSPQNGSNSNEQTQTNTQLTPQPPPIFIYGVLNYKKMIDNLSNITEEETYQCKILKNDTVKINTLNPDTYRKLIRHLNSGEIIHHTHQMKQDRAYRVVIRNLHYSIPIDEIKEELQKKGHAVRNILNTRHRVNKYPLSMFYVDLEPKENKKEIYNLQCLNNMKINVEPPYKKIPSYNVQDISSMATQKHTARGPTNV